MPQGESQYFTLEEANKTLPYVRRIVADIVAAHSRWRDEVKNYELAPADEQVALQEQVNQVAVQINEYLEELTSVGCVFKGFDDGLVDFRSLMGGKEVCLCWRLGEPEVLYWHEQDAGFSGRQKIQPELVSKGSA